MFGKVYRLMTKKKASITQLADLVSCYKCSTTHVNDNLYVSVYGLFGFMTVLST